MSTPKWAISKILEAKVNNSSSIELVGKPRLKFIPDELFELDNLITIDLGYNKISDVPSSISKLTKLESLSLRATNIEIFPKSVLHLKKLKSLNISITNISSLPKELLELKELEFLSIGKTSIRVLPHVLWELSNLKILNLYNLGLEKIPKEILSLTKLEMLNLRGNRITDLPSWLFNLNYLKSLVLSNNPIMIPPPEIVLSSVKRLDQTVDIIALRNYFHQIKEEGESLNYEAKLLILGEGGVGKTTFAKKLSDINYKPSQDEEKSTEGVDILRWKFKLPNYSDNMSVENRYFYVNIWDFGGQEIYHATHQFFLTRRSVYVLVSDTRREDGNFYYWFKAQETFGDDSPLLLLKNKKRGTIPSPDEATLRERFPNFKSSMTVDLLNAEKDDNWEMLLRELKHNFMSLEYIGTPLPKTWVRVRREIEKSNQNTMEIEEFYQLCISNGIKEKRNALQLSDYLHNIGVILHFQDDPILIDTVILKPTWGLDAVYKVLDNEEVKKQLGHFNRIQLRELWSEDKYNNKREELLRLMQKFQICYPLPNNQDSFLAPHLLSVERPQYIFTHTDNLQIRYYYPKLMPKGILSRMIVILHDIIESQNLVWRTGVILKMGYARAEILELRADNEIFVRVSGKNKRDLLMRIVQAMIVIHNPFPTLEYKKLVPCNCQVCKKNSISHFYDLDNLLERLANNKLSIECEKPPYASVNIYDLIDEQFELNKLQAEYSNSIAKNIYADTVYINEGEIKNETNNLNQSISKEEIKNLLQSLYDESLIVAESLEGDIKDGFIDDIEMIKNEALKEKPRKKYIEFSAKGVLDAAEKVGKVGNELAKLAPKLLELLSL